MQGKSFALSSSLSLHSSTNPRLRSSNLKFHPACLSHSSKSIINGGASGFASFCFKSSLSSPLLSSRFGSGSLLTSRGRRSVDEVNATTTEREEGEEPSILMQTVQLGLLFALWYLFNIYFNIYNKQVLKVFSYPVTITMVQLAVGSVLILFMWGLNLYKKPKINRAQLIAILPLALIHTLGNLFTNISLGKVSVAFTHTVKATEPFFTVILSAMFLGEIPTLWVVSSLVPIMGGVMLASATEASFNWPGFWSAMASNLTNQSRNVLSKKLMVKKEESLDNITLFSVITILSLFMITPVAFFMEGVKFTPAYLQSAGLNLNEVYIRTLLASICFHAYQQISYMILQKVSPVTHSVGNCVKRVVVIVSSVFFFKTPVSLVNSIGTGIALAGVFFYSRVKGIKPKAKEV